MQKIALGFILLASFTSSHLFADTRKEIQSPDMYIKNVMKILSGANANSNCVGEMKKNVPNFRQCMQKICGAPEINSTYISQYQDLRARIGDGNNPHWDKFRKLIEKWAKVIDKEKSNEIESIKRGAQLIVKGKAVIADELSGISYLATNLAFAQLLDIAPEISPDGKYTLVVDAEKSKEFFPAYINIKESLDMLVKVTQLITGGSYLGIIDLKEKYPNKSIPEILKIELDSGEQFLEVIEKKPEMKKLFSLLGDNLDSVKGLLKTFKTRLAEKGQNIDDHDVDQLLTFTQTLGTLQIFTSDSGLYSNDKNFIDSFFEKLLKNKKLIDDIAKMKITENSSMGPEFVAVMESCKQSFLEGQFVLDGVSDGQAEKLIQEAKGLVRKNILAHLSSHSALILNKHLDNVYFSKPLSPKNFVESFGFYLSQSIDSANEEMALAPNVQATTDVLSALGYLADNLSSHKGGGEMKHDKYEDIKQLCETYASPTINDSALLVKSGKIQVSWNSIRDPRAGAGIITHEIGHVISGVILSNPSMSANSSKIYSIARECINSNNVFTKKAEMNDIVLASAQDQVSHRDGFYTEEDWADTISAKSTSAEYNPWCFFLSKKVKQDGVTVYDDLPLEPTPNDTHSSDLFRLLNVEFIKKGAIPLECNVDYLLEKGIRFKKCL